jgi:ATP synthase protein I
VSEDSEFSRAVAAKVARKLRAQRNSTQGVWFGLGMMGLVGWSVAIPALAGTAWVSGWTAIIQEIIPGR